MKALETENDEKPDPLVKAFFPALVLIVSIWLGAAQVMGDFRKESISYVMTLALIAGGFAVRELAIVAKETRAKPRSSIRDVDEHKTTKSNHLVAALFCLGFIVAIAALKFVGFIPIFALVIVSVTKALGAKSHLGTILLTAVSVALIALVFVELIGLPIPQGSMWAR